jgi:hypothetical protein
MKLNPKIYKQLTQEPFDTQEINGKIVEFHYLNDTPYLFQFASKGRFAIWTSDGNNFKVLVEKRYYEMLSDFYLPEVNTIWLNFLSKVGALSRKVNNWFMIPSLIMYVVVAGLATWLFPDYTMEILIGLVVLIIIGNIFQGRYLNQKVAQENKNTQDEIRDYLGIERFNKLVDNQAVHYQEYFKFEEEPVQETEVIVEKKEAENDGTKSN